MDHKTVGFSMESSCHSYLLVDVEEYCINHRGLKRPLEEVLKARESSESSIQMDLGWNIAPINQIMFWCSDITDLSLIYEGLEAF